MLGPVPSADKEYICEFVFETVKLSMHLMYAYSILANAEGPEMQKELQK
jgi:hypothetical protein